MDLLGLRTLPFLSRRNYYFEFKHLLFWSVPAGLVEGQFVSVVVSKTFHGSDRLIAIASATPLAALLFSLVWGMLCLGRPKVRLAILFAAGTALCTGLAGLIPISPVGAIWFLVQMAAAQILIAGVITVRSALWKSNYPQSDRGRIVARLQAARFLISVGTVLVAAALCDRDPTAYRYVFPTAALIGVIGISLLPNIHVRGERCEVLHDGAGRADGYPRKGQAEPFGLTALISPGNVFGQMLRVLRDDRRFAWYCAAQFLMGASNFMVVPVLVAVVTREMPIGSAWGFWISTGLIVALPRLTMLGTLRRWGGLLDRLGVVRLRVFSTTCWLVAMGLGTVATYVVVTFHHTGAPHLFLAIALFAARGVLAGFSQGGGTLAWNVGHLHFARKDLAEIYMGTHVSLTGLRGLLAPLAGMWLWARIGWVVWLIAMGSTAISLVIYLIMARNENRHTEAQPARDGRRYIT